MTSLRYDQINAPLGPFKNFFDNPFMQVKQRLIASSAANSSFVCDRWQMLRSGMAINPTQGEGVSGYAAVNAGGHWRDTLYVTFDSAGAGADHYTILWQKLPFPFRFSNAVFTEEFWIYPTFSGVIGLEKRFRDGVAGTDDIYEISSATYPVVANVWQRIRHLVSFPAWTPTALGEEARMEALMWLTTGTNRSAEASYTGPQTGTLSVTSSAFVPGDQRHIAQNLSGMPDYNAELRNCLPYYERSHTDDDVTLHTANMSANQDYFFPYEFKAPKFLDNPDVDILTQSHAGTVNSGTFSLQRVKRTGFSVKARPSSSDVNGYVRFTWECNSEL